MKRVRTVFNGVAGVPYYSNIYFGDTESAQACADKVGAFWTGVGVYIVSDVQHAVDPVVVTIDAATGETTGAESVTGPVGTGDAAGDPLPLACQMLIQFRTGAYIGGRELRGRLFVPAIPETIAVDGVPSSSSVTGMTTFVNAWIDSGPAPLIWSRVHLETRSVVQASVWNQFAVLRSRRD